MQTYKNQTFAIESISEKEAASLIVDIIRSLFMGTFPGWAYIFNYLFKVLDNETSIRGILEQSKTLKERRTGGNGNGSEIDTPVSHVIHWINLMCCVGTRLENLKGNVRIQDLEEITLECLKKSYLPDFMFENLSFFIPRLLFEQIMKRQILKRNEFLDKPFVIFYKSNIPKSCDSSEVRKRQKDASEGKIDIYLENIDSPRIIVKKKIGVFRPGDYTPFQILCLFASRIDTDVSYAEIYNVGILPFEYIHPTDRSKKVYNYVNYILNKLASVEGILLNDVKKWFERKPKRGIIHISKELNICLISSKENAIWI